MKTSPSTPPSVQPSTAVWWIRRDLRLSDNLALASALESAERVIPLYILDPTLLRSRSHSEKRQAFLLDGLRQLDHDLRARGSSLVLRQGRPEQVVAALAAEAGANVVFAERDFSPYAKRRDSAVGRSVLLKLVAGTAIHPPDALRKADGSVRRIFTPFRRAWQELPLPAMSALPSAPPRLPSPGELAGLPIPEAAASAWFPAGEAEALRRLAAFTSGDQSAICTYVEARNRLDTDGSSNLSPYLRFGMLSPQRALTAARQALSRASGQQARRGVGTWIAQLIWRDFYIHTLDASPEVLDRALKPAYERMAWEPDEAGAAAWRSGRTGYPIVDAAMRQLEEVGWIPNRARMIVGAFLTKDLLVDWRLGQDWFMHHLVDGDPAANAGGWQWVSGAGTDGLPYLRVFNPLLQAKKFDPAGDYVRRWIPELEGVPRLFVHEPWRMSDETQRASGCVIGRDYPAPIIHHAQARIRALTAYRAAVTGKRVAHSR